MRSSKLVHFSVLKPSLSTSALWIWGQRAATLPARVCNGNPATLSPWQSIRDQKTQRRPLIYTSPLIIQEVKLINWDLDASDKVRKISVAPQHLLCIFLPLNKGILHLPIISAPGLIWSCDRFAGITHVLRKRGMKEDEAQAVVATCAFISNLCLFVQLTKGTQNGKCGILSKTRARGNPSHFKSARPASLPGSLKNKINTRGERWLTRGNVWMPWF